MIKLEYNRLKNFNNLITIKSNEITGKVFNDFGMMNSHIDFDHFVLVQIANDLNSHQYHHSKLDYLELCDRKRFSY